MEKGHSEEDRPINDLDGGVVELGPGCEESIRSHATDDYPHECCGLLVGKWAEDGRMVVVRAERARNLNTERAHDRYELDPRDYLRVDKEAREEGLDVVGFYHSHPDSPPLPSHTDAERAWPAYSYVIVSVRRGKPEEMRCWTLDEPSGTFSEQEIRRVSGPS